MRLGESARQMEYLHGLARHLGIPIVATEPYRMWDHEVEKHWKRERVYWDGRILHCAHTDQLLHEIAHFIIADDDDRRKENWGLNSMSKEKAEAIEDLSDSVERALMAGMLYSLEREFEAVSWEGFRKAGGR